MLRALLLSESQLFLPSVWTLLLVPNTPLQVALLSLPVTLGQPARSVMQPGKCGWWVAVLSGGREDTTPLSAGFWVACGPVLARGSPPHRQ